MRLLPRFGRKREPLSEDDYEVAREEALRRLRSRRGDAADVIFRVPDPAPVIPGEAPAEEAEPLPEDAGGEAREDGPPDFLSKDAPASEAGETTAASEGGQEPAADELGLAEAQGEGLGDDLLDIFREAKNEVVETSLAGEVDDVSIDELLDDLAGISARLGVWRPQMIARQVQREAHDADVAVEGPAEPEIRVEKIIPAPVELAPEEEVVQEPAAEIEIESLLAPEAPAEPPPEPLNQPVRRDPPPLPPEKPPGRGPSALLHVLFLGLTLTLAGGLGFRAVSSGGASVRAAAAPTPAVLTAFQTPQPSALAASASPSASASPTPSPSPSPSPSPTPAPAKTPSVQAYDPAWFVYRVESGDSLTSIAIANGLCPDHILWNNPGREEETPLIVNDRLIIPKMPGVIHEIREGDTLQKIALLYNSAVEAITGVPGNQVESDHDLIVGDEILVPGGIPQSAFELDNAAHKMMTTPSFWGFVWPFFGEITTFYGEERPGYIHKAIDIGGLGHYGITVGAAASGTVVLVDNDPIYGQNVIIEHADGSRTRYAHFSKVYVEQGQEVGRSNPVGALGCSGDSTGTHLHFELWRDGEAIDPLEYLP